MEDLIGKKFPHPFRVGRPPFHVRGIVDGKIVGRSWLRSKQDWLYEVLEMDCLSETKVQ